VTSDAHNQLARTLSAHSHVLLKNDGNLLPLAKGEIKNIVVVGEQGDKDVVIGGGGSGSVSLHVEVEYPAQQAFSCKGRF
jgi:beta-glucosidase